MLQFNAIEESSYRLVIGNENIVKNNLIRTTYVGNRNNIKSQPNAYYSEIINFPDKDSYLENVRRINNNSSENISKNNIIYQCNDYSSDLELDNMKFFYISECTDPTCVYTRCITNIRERFEKKILETAKNKNNIKILFFGSFLLYQELRISILLDNKISEIHLTDYAYKNFLNNNNKSYILAFTEFMNYIDLQKWNIKVYVHSDPDKLKRSKIFQRRFDIICGIDIDYTNGHNNNRPIMKEIAQNTLKINGVMYMSQHNLDQVDLCRYEISDNATIKLVSTEDFVKKEYYLKYTIQNLLYQLYYPFSFTGLYLSAIYFKKSPILSIITGTYCITGIVYKYLTTENNSNNFERKISIFSNLLKKNIN